MQGQSPYVFQNSEANVDCNFSCKTVKLNERNSLPQLLKVRKYNNSSIRFLRDREMPITNRETREQISKSCVTENQICNENFVKCTQNINVASGNDKEFKFASNLATKYQRQQFPRLQSRSLPKYFMRTR